MEEVNPWLDPNVGKHKNKKSIRPESKPLVFPSTPVKSDVVSKKAKETQEIKEVKEIQQIQLEKETKGAQQDKLLPGMLKTNNERVMSFFTTLVEDSLDIDLPPYVSQWAIENFDEKWLQEFLEDIKHLREDILTSKYFPSSDKMLLLKLIFLLRQ